MKSGTSTLYEERHTRPHALALTLALTPSPSPSLPARSLYPHPYPHPTQELRAHPKIAPPSTKELRYLSLPKYRHHTGTWYASHLTQAAVQHGSLTLTLTLSQVRLPLHAGSRAAGLAHL